MIAGEERRGKKERRMESERREWRKRYALSLVLQPHTDSLSA